MGLVVRLLLIFVKFSRECLLESLRLFCICKLWSEKESQYFLNFRLIIYYGIMFKHDFFSDIRSFLRMFGKIVGKDVILHQQFYSTSLSGNNLRQNV